MQAKCKIERATLIIFMMTMTMTTTIAVINVCPG